MDQSSRRTYFYAFLLSILFHVLVVLLLLALNAFASLNGDNVESQPEPLVLEFEQPPQPERIPPEQPEEQPQEEEEAPEEEVPEELAEREPVDLQQIPLFHENPNSVKAPDEETLILSEQSSRSAAPDITETGDAIAPNTDPGSMPEKGEDIAEQDAEAEDNPEESVEELLDDLTGDEAVKLPSNAPEFSRNKLTNKSETDGENLRPHENVAKVDLVQKEFNAQEVGEFRLSTYDWNYVPWQQAFIAKLYRVWQAPSAWYIGLIHGYTVIRFKVSRDGKLLGYEVLEHNGHESLRTGNVNAIESVFPFRDLPGHFPDDHLEITFRMIYPDLKKLRRR